MYKLLYISKVTGTSCKASLDQTWKVIGQIGTVGSVSVCVCYLNFAYFLLLSWSMYSPSWNSTSMSTTSSSTPPITTPIPSSLITLPAPSWELHTLSLSSSGDAESEICVCVWGREGERKKEKEREEERERERERRREKEREIRECYPCYLSSISLSRVTRYNFKFCWLTSCGCAAVSSLLSSLRHFLSFFFDKMATTSLFLSWIISNGEIKGS